MMHTVTNPMIYIRYAIVLAVLAGAIKIAYKHMMPHEKSIVAFSLGVCILTSITTVAILYIA